MWQASIMELNVFFSLSLSNDSAIFLALLFFLIRFLWRSYFDIEINFFPSPLNFNYIGVRPVLMSTLIER